MSPRNEKERRAKLDRLKRSAILNAEGPKDRPMVSRERDKCAMLRNCRGEIRSTKLGQKQVESCSLGAKCFTRIVEQ